MLETFQKYQGSGLIISWFLLAWVFLLLKEKKKQNRVIFVYMPAVVLLCFFNPLFFRVFGDLTEEAIYFRFLWLLPVTTVIAYSAIVLTNGLRQNRKIPFGIIISFLIMASGKLVYTSPLFEKAENPYHVPQEVVEICDMIRVDGREVMAAFPEEFLLYVRQYSPYVCMPYGRDALNYHDEFLGLMRKESINVELLAEMAKKKGCHYVIISQEKELIGNMEDYQYEEFGRVGEYIIFWDTTIYKGL